VRTGRTLAVLVAAFVLTSCGGSGPEGAEPSRPVKVVGAKDAVREAALVVGDLPKGFGDSDPGMGADVLAGSVSVDVCWPSARMVSESERVARHFANFPAPDGSSSVGSEVVAYRHGGVEQALKEIRSAIATCPKKFVRDTSGAGLPAQRLVLVALPRLTTWQPGSVAVRTASYFKGERTPFNVTTAVFQPHGDLLSILTFRTVEAAEFLDEISEVQGERVGSISVRAAG
jgi:hypothetical protein